MLFNETLNATNEEIRKYIPISQNLAFAKLSPSIEAAERDYLRPLFGAQTLAQLQSFYDNDGSGDPEHEQEWAQLLELCQRAVINMAFLIGYDVLSIEIDDAGFGRTESTSRKGLFKYQEDNLRQWFKSTGFNTLDEILSFMHLNTEVFTAYAASSEYTRFKTSFFKSVADFDTVYFINASNLTFRRLKQYIKLTEDFELKKLFGATLWEYIKTEMASDDPAEKVTALIPYIKNPLAYLAVAYLMEETGADLAENGLYFTAWIANDKSQQEKLPASTDRIKTLVDRNKGIGANYMAELKNYLKANATDWPTFSPAPAYPINRNNTNRKTFWA